MGNSVVKVDEVDKVDDSVLINAVNSMKNSKISYTLDDLMNSITMNIDLGPSTFKVTTITDGAARLAKLDSDIKDMKLMVKGMILDPTNEPKYLEKIREVIYDDICLYHLINFESVETKAIYHETLMKIIDILK